MLSKFVKITIQKLLSGYKELLVALLILAISFPASAQLLTPSKILLTFSEPMSRETIFDPDNYIVIANENTSVKVFKVGLVQGDSSVVLFIDKEDDCRNDPHPMPKWGREAMRCCAVGSLSELARSPALAATSSPLAARPQVETAQCCSVIRTGTGVVRIGSTRCT